MSPNSNSAGRVLFVDDDADVLQAATLVLRRHGFAMDAVQKPDLIWTALAEAPADVILLDMNFLPGDRSGDEGLETLRRIMAQDPDAVVLVVTGHSGVSIAVAAMRAGAADFIMKPWSNDRLAAAVSDAVALRRRRRAGSLSVASNDALIVGASPAACRLRARVARLAAANSPALIIGESGAGKSLAAQAIHAASAHRHCLLLTIDLKALAPEVQIERMGEMTSGSLLLKSVDALHPAVFGAVSEMISTSSVRVLATSPDAEVTSRWPDSLRFGLAGVQLQVPALRARRADIPDLSRHFIRRAEASAGRLPRPISQEAEAWLSGAEWSGNVRELKAVVEQAVLLGEGDSFELSDFKPPLPSPSQPRVIAPDEDLNLVRQERRLVEAALKRHGFNVSQAAQDLGLTRAALYRRMDKHGL
jgi:DNA-binding NtrC family response regulator